MVYRITSLSQRSRSIKSTTNHLSYKLGLNDEKKSMETWHIIKNGHSEDETFRICKLGKILTAQEVIFIMALLP